MNFLITGAAGFLGSTLANRLAREGHQVRGLDDLSTGDPRALSPDVLFTRGDVNDRPKLWTLLQDVDCVYHLAARVLVAESVLYPREYNAVNVGGTVSLMEAMRDVGVRRVVLISSGAIYGDQGSQPLREDAVPNPRSPYAVSKLAPNTMYTLLATFGASRRLHCGFSMPMVLVNTCRHPTRRSSPISCARRCVAGRWWCMVMAARRAITFLLMTWSAPW